MIVVFRFVLTKLCWSSFCGRSSLSYENGECFKGILTTCWMQQVSIKFGHKSIPDEINLEFNVMKKRDRKCPAGVHPVAFWGWWKKNWIHDFRPQNQRGFEFNLWVKWSMHKILEDFLFRRRFRDGSRNLITISNAQDASSVDKNRAFCFQTANVLSFAGWFWSGSGARMAPTNSTPDGWMRNPWSHTGYIGQFLSGMHDMSEEVTKWGDMDQKIMTHWKVYRWLILQEIRLVNLTTPSTCSIPVGSPWRPVFPSTMIGITTA